jgi:hypothetical protein
MVGVPAAASVEVSAFGDAVALDHFIIWSVLRSRWTYFVRNVEKINPPPPHLVVVVTIEHEISVVIFTINTILAELLIYDAN